MKVVIGNYPKGKLISSFFYDYLDKKYNFNWPEEENYTKREKFLNKLQNMIQWVYDVTFNKFLNKTERKIYVRIDPQDLWNMDNTLAHIILPMLKQLKETKHGTPYVDDEDVPENLRPILHDTLEEADDKFLKRWNYVFDEMIYNFECEVNDDWEDQFHSGKIDFSFVEEGIMKFGSEHTHVFDKEAYGKAWDRRNNGLRLFGKYYGSLWD